MKSLTRTVALAVVVTSFFSGCLDTHHESVLEKVRHSRDHGSQTVPRAEQWLDGISHLPAESGDFSIRTRTDQLAQFPCSQCHDANLTLRPDGTDVDAAASGLPRHAHPQIHQPHGKAEALICSTCHQAEDPSVLRIAQSSPVGFDQSYELCGVCHFEQRRDWQAGAHGKRLAIWSQPRVIENCTGCHDPHAPAFEQRLPATAFPGVVTEKKR